MVRLAGDVAPERFNGFYNQVAPGVDLMKRQFQDIPSPDYLVRQSGLHAGFPKPRTKLRNIDGFMNSSTNFNSVQNAPHFIRMRYQHLAQRAAERAARELEENRKKIHYLKQMDADRKEARRTKVKAAPYKSEAAGLKLKQALRQVLYKGDYRMQRETTRSVKQKKLLDKFVGRDSDTLLRKIAKVEEPLDEDDLDELKRADKKLQAELAVAAAGTPGGVAPQTVERLRRARRRGRGVLDTLKSGATKGLALSKQFGVADALKGMDNSKAKILGQLLSMAGGRRPKRRVYHRRR